MKEHLRSHRGEKPLKCIYCSADLFLLDVWFCICFGFFFFIIIIWNIEIKPPFEVHLVPHSGERPYKCNLFSYFALANYQHNNFYYHVYYLDLFYFSKFFQRSSKKNQLLEIICSLTSEKSHTNVYCSALLLLFTCLFNFFLFFKNMFLFT